MKTNKEKYDYFYKKIESLGKEFIDSVLKDPPKELYKVVLIGRIDKYEVEYIGYYNRIYSEEKPTRKDIEKIKSYYENMPEMTIDDIRIGIVHHGEKYKSSCAIAIGEIGKSYHPSIEHANKALARLQLKKKKDEELLANGHIRCTYCRKIIPEDKAVKHEIIFQDWNGYKKFVNRKTNKYCSGKCGSYDQMSREG